MTKNKLALLGGKPTGGPKQPKYPLFSKSAIRQVVDLLETGRTVGLGRTNTVIAKAEQAISQYHGNRHALVVNSGHAALMSALMGLEIGPGDEVITTPYTWGASTSCILDVGAVPIFADVDPLTGLLDPKKVEPAITKKTRAILVVHLYVVKVCRADAGIRRTAHASGRDRPAFFRVAVFGLRCDGFHGHLPKASSVSRQQLAPPQHPRPSGAWAVGSSVASLAFSGMVDTADTAGRSYLVLTSPSDSALISLA